MKNTDAKVALKLQGRTIADKLALWEGTAKAVPGMEALKNVVPPVGDVAGLATALAEANARTEEAKRTVINLLVVRAAAEEAFDAAFTTFGGSVQALAGGNAALITEAALPLASQSTTPVALAKIDGVNVTQGDEKGHVDVAWHGSSRAKSYVVRYGLGGGPDKLTETKVVTKSRVSLLNLASGQEGWVTVYAVGAEDGPPSDPVRFMVP